MHCPAQVRRETRRNQPPNRLRLVLTKTLAWSFSSSGVERTFARGGWVKANRRVTRDLVNDELRAVHYQGAQDQFHGQIFSNRTQRFKVGVWNH